MRQRYEFNLRNSLVLSFLVYGKSESCVFAQRIQKNEESKLNKGRMENLKYNVAFFFFNMFFLLFSK